MSHAPSIFHGLIRASILTIVGLFPTHANSQSVGLAILKIDPDPVATGAKFDVVFQITNPKATPVKVTVNTTFDNPLQNPTINSRVFEIAPGQSNALEMTGSYEFPGNHIMHVTASVKNGSTTVLVASAIRAVSVYSATSPPVRPRLFNPGPDQVNAQITAPTQSGVVGALAGSSGALFAIPKTGGVWRSVNGETWLPLPKSPPRAFSIALDELGGTHVAVGEREDDNTNAQLGRSGVWESVDSGDTWTYTFDPSLVADSQKVPALAFSSSTGTLFVATSAGVLRRPKSPNAARPFSQPFSMGYRKALDQGCQTTAMNTPLGPITALVTSETRVWARSASELFFSDDDGATWNCWAFPGTANLPGESGVPAIFDSVGKNSATDNASLGAFDDQAFVIFTATGTSANNSITTVLIFDPATLTHIEEFSLDRDGRGLGGNRFIKTFSVDPDQCPALASRAIGKGHQVVLGSGQSVQQATGVDSAGRLVWDKFVGSSEAGQATYTINSDGDLVTLNPPQNIKKQIHADFWDFLLPADFCPPSRPSVYLANDGGVYQGTSTDGTSQIFPMTWATHSEGLHVQTSENLAFAEASPVQPGSTKLSYFMGYPTQDNESWWRTNLGEWISSVNQGDSNYIAGDVALPQAITWLHYDFKDAFCSPCATFFNGNTQSTFSLSRRFVSGAHQPFDGGGVVQAVQTLTSETTPSSLDMVMLVQLPLSDANDNPIPDPPGGTGSGQRLAIIRNPSFSNKPDGPAHKYSGWIVVNDAIPSGAGRLWVSGGHSNTQYFLYTDSSNSSCPNGLVRLTYLFRPPNLPPQPPFWRCVVQNLLGQGSIIDYLGDPTRQQGPAFVDPFDSDKALVVVQGSTDDANSLQMTLDGNTFCKLPILTALVTESGRYPIVASMNPGTAFGDVSSVFHGFPLAVPSHVSFNRHNDSYVLVSSPYTGLYLGTVSNSTVAPGTCKESWQDLSPYLPTSRAYISATGFVGDTALITTEGRGAYAIYNQSSAQIASYFELMSSITKGGIFATLKEANGAVIPWGSVLVRGRSTATPSTPLSVSMRADAHGHLLLPNSFLPSSYVMDLVFEGDGTVAPSVTKFLLSVN